MSEENEIYEEIPPEGEESITDYIANDVIKIHISATVVSITAIEFIEAIGDETEAIVSLLSIPRGAPIHSIEPPNGDPEEDDEHNLYNRNQIVALIKQEITRREIIKYLKIHHSLPPEARAFYCPFEPSQR